MTRTEAADWPSRQASAQPINVTPKRLRRLHEYSAERCRPGRARQRQGFEFEDAVIVALGLDAAAGQQNPFDAYRYGAAGEVLERYSIKAPQVGNTVQLAKFEEQATLTDDFYMIVGRHQREPKNHFTEIYVMHVPGGFWSSLWPRDLSPFTTEAYYEGFGPYCRDADFQAAWKARLRERAEQWEAALPPGSPLRINPKFSRSNRRVQCSISNVGFTEFFERTYSESKTREFEGRLDA